MKKTGIAIAVIAVFLVLAYSQRDAIVGRVMPNAIETRMAADRIADLGDGLHLGLCGAGGPLPAPKASGPCVAVVAGGKLFVVDSGTDGPRNMGRMGLPPGRLAAVFLTHFHSDHIDGLGEMATQRWAGGTYESPLPVYGPEGVERVVDGFNQAYAQDFVYRHEHHGDLVAPTAAAGVVALPFEKPAMGELATLYDQDGIKIEALTVEHLPVDPAVGYRFSYGGRTLLITGDTIKSDNIIKFSEGIDLLVHEALAPNLVMMMNQAAQNIGAPGMAKITIDILDYHASPVEAAETAKEADVGHLLYYHIVPPLIVPGQDVLFLDGAEDIFPDYTIGVDGVLFSLPANSDEIIKVSEGL